MSPLEEIAREQEKKIAELQAALAESNDNVTFWKSEAERLKNLLVMYRGY